MDDTEFQLSVRDGVTQDEQDDAGRTVAALVARAKLASERRRTAVTESAELAGALSKPFEQVINNDPDARRALENLTQRQLVRLEEPDQLQTYLDRIRPEAPADDSGLRSNLGFAPPYDFQWAWHDTNGSAPFGIVQNRNTGEVGADARSGLLDGGAAGFVNAHVGFGVFLNWGPGQKFPHAVLNPGRFSHVVRAVGVGSNATSEGGFELTIFEDGQFLTGASRRLWRSRVSGTLFDPDESASGGMGNHVITGPELQFTLRAGHGYTFNAGVWVYSDRSTGVGGGAAQSLLQGTLTRMWVFG